MVPYGSIKPKVTGKLIPKKVDVGPDKIIAEYEWEEEPSGGRSPLVWTVVLMLCGLGVWKLLELVGVL